MNRKNIVFFILISLIYPTKTNADIQKSEELLKYILKGQYHTLPKIELNEVISLIKRGADINYQDKTGFTPLHYAIESLSALSFQPSPAHSQSMFEVMKYLLESGAKLNIIGDDGKSPIQMLIRFYYPGGDPFNNRMLQLVLNKYGADLNLHGQRGMSGIQYAVRYKPLKTIKFLIKQSLNHVSFTSRHKFFGNILHILAINTRDLEKIKFVFSQIPIHQRDVFVQETNVRGLTPLAIAVINNNLPMAEYLLKYYSANPNVYDNEHRLLKQIAREEKQLAMEVLLKKYGAKDHFPQQVDECGEQQGNFNFERVKKLVDGKCASQINSVENFISILSPELKSSYVLMHRSRALMGARPLSPKVISFSRDGNFYLTFNGHSQDAGFNTIEFAQFNQKNNSFSFFEVDFNKSPRLSKINPQKCLTCHGNDPRPLWDVWPIWQGTYGGDASFLIGTPKKNYHQYLKLKNQHNRYQHLTNHFGYASAQVEYGDKGIPDARFGAAARQLSKVIRHKLARLITDRVFNDPELPKYKATILASLSCKYRHEYKNSLDYFPPSLTPQRDEYKDIEHWMIKSHRRLDAYNLKQIKQELPAGENLSPELRGYEYPYFPSNNRAGGNLEVVAVRNLLYLTKLVKGSTDITNNWSSLVTMHDPSIPFHFGEHAEIVEYFMWKHVMKSYPQYKKLFGDWYKEFFQHNNDQRRAETCHKLRSLIRND